MGEGHSSVGAAYSPMSLRWSLGKLFVHVLQIFRTYDAETGGIAPNFNCHLVRLWLAFDSNAGLDPESVEHPISDRQPVFNSAGRVSSLDVYSRRSATGMGVGLVSFFRLWFLRLLLLLQRLSQHRFGHARI